MSYTVKSIDDQAVYDQFIGQPLLKPHATFMHTWQWGEVMREESTDFMRLGIYRADELVGVVQAMKLPLRLGGYFWYSPRGVALDYSDGQLVTAVYEALNKFVKTKGGAFFRVDPDIVRGDPAEAAIDRLGPSRAAIFTQAERVWCVDLQKDEASLLEWMKNHDMRSNVPRYLRKAAKAGVTVRVSDSPKDLDVLVAMLQKLRARKGMGGKHDDDHLRLQFAKLGPKSYEKMFLAEKDGEVLACALIAIYGREACYLHGASSDQERDLSAPHTMHLEIMKYCMAERPEVERYNFWGIVGDKNRKPGHPRHGYSEFKRSFGGYKERYIRARDFVYNPLAWRADWLLQKYWAWKFKND